MEHPKFSFGLLDLHSRSHKYSDDELEKLATWLRAVDCRYLRLLPAWKTNLPYKKGADGLFDWRKKNPIFESELKRVAHRFRKHGIDIWFDLFDACSNRIEYPWSWWLHNKQGIHGIYDYSQSAIEHFKYDWIDWLFDILPNKRTLWGLGNELQIGNDDNPPAINEWCLKWLIPIAQYLIEKGARRPLYYSAGMKPGGTQNHIAGWLSDEVPEAGFKATDTVAIVHGIGTAKMWQKNIVDKNILSARRLYGISDDGVGCNAETTVPPECKGNCETDDGQRCKANSKCRTEAVKAVKATLKPNPVCPQERLVMVEFLPAEIAMDYRHIINDLDFKASIEIYAKIRREIYGERFA